jgi:hypothetical protein
MPFIPRQVKPPARLAITCKVPEETGTLLKHYAEFLESTQEYVVTETLRLAFRRDKEFHVWLATTHPETRLTERDSPTRPVDHPGPADPSRPTLATSKTATLHDSRGER